MIGIYCIENIENKKKYIGQSVDIFCRLRKHFTKLRKGKHENIYLQRSFDKYGEKNFHHYIVEQCSKENLNEKEKYWIKEYDSFDNGFNLTIGGDGVNGWKGDEAFKKKMREIVSGENNPNYGNHWTDDMKQKLSEQRKGIYANENNPNSKRIICIEKMKIYETINDASNDCGCKNQSSISRCLKNKGNIANGFHFIIYSDEMYQYLLKHKFEYLCECCKDKNIIADMTNKKLYHKYELRDLLYQLCNFTTREIKEITNQSKFELNNVQYVLL